MAQEDTFKITYATLSAPSEEMHLEYDRAIEKVRKGMGNTHAMWIDGREVSGRETFDNRCPADTELVIGRFQNGASEDAAAAVDAAISGFAAWSHTSWHKRVELMLKAADILSSQRFELAALMSYEVGKNRFEALGDVEEGADLIRYYCKQMEDADGFDRPMGKLSPNEKTRDVLRPYGVWVVISPFNFPLALPAGMMAGALIAGNTVVFKPAPDSSSTALRLYEALREAGLPPGAVQFVTGAGPTVGKELVANPKVSGLVFTGSKKTGLQIHQEFNRGLPRPCILELGGKNPTIVTAKADLDKAAEGVTRSAFGLGGQKCSACSRVYVERSVTERFKATLLDKTRELKVGDPLARDTFMGPLISEKACRNFERHVADARRDGKILYGGELLTDEPFHKGYFVTPTLVDGLPLDHQLFREELFVPLLTIGEVGSLGEALELANRTEYGLTAGIFSEDREEIELFFDRIQAGVTFANRRSGATTGAWPGVNPFCGWKASGSSGKGVCGPYYVQQFLREQSQTVLE